MKTTDLNYAIARLEKEVQYLYIDYSRLLSQYAALNELTTIKLKIKHAEESLRLKRRMLCVSANGF